MYDGGYWAVWVGRVVKTMGLEEMRLTAKIILGMLPSSAMTCSLDTASVFPTISLILVGLYFSTCNRV